MSRQAPKHYDDAFKKQIVELHHGTIQARSQDEVIEFEVVLPVS